MTPGARLSAAIEILDDIITAARTQGSSADKLVAAYFRTRRYAGSKDRRAVRELVWQAVRRFGTPPPSGRAAFAALADENTSLAALFDGQGHAPAPLGREETRAKGGPVPEWIVERFDTPKGGIDPERLLDRAPIDIRINRLKAGDEPADAIASDIAIEAERLAELPDAFRLPTGFPVEQSKAWGEGLVEIQDYGSQLIVSACRAEPDMTALDLCAGAGGKALAITSSMNNQGHVIASDINRQRLSRLLPRAERAGANIIETRLLDPGREAEKLSDLEQGCDIVLVDAPCSGSGTWRRNPETRWRLTPERLDALVRDQARLLDLAALYVRPGGVLVYAVCALTQAEGSGQIAQFLLRNRAFRADELPVHAGRAVGDGRMVTPCHDGSDGFFFARLAKIA